MDTWRTWELMLPMLERQHDVLALTLPGHPEVFVLGDMIRVRSADGNVQPLPGVAPVAIQQGVHAARAIRRRLRGEPVVAFRYRDKGNVATIGRGS